MGRQFPPPDPTHYQRNGFFRIRRRKSSDQHKPERRNTFVINLNGLKNGFRPRNIGTQFLSSHPQSPPPGSFSPPYAIPSNLISDSSWTPANGQWTSANGFQLTSHHQLNNIVQYQVHGHDVNNPEQNQMFIQKDEEDPNKIVEIESDDSPPYLPSSAAHQRPITVTPPPSPTAPPNDQTLQGIREEKQSRVTQVDLHHQREPPFQFHSNQEDLSC